MLQPRKQLTRIGRRAGRRQQWRYESSSHHGSTHDAHHAEPVNEHLGRGFYLTVAAIPLGFALYKFSLSDDGQPFFTRMIQKYSDFQESFAERNALHTRVMEQAAHDRNLFVNSQGSGYVDLNFPEQFNTGSPFSVPAGHSADLTELIAFYHKKSADNEARKVEKLRARAENSTK